MAFHPDITRRDDVSLALDAANSAVRIASRQLTGNAGTVEIPNADGTSTIMGVGAGGSGIAPWVGDTTAPGRPTGITAVSGNGMIVVSWDGTLDGGIPSDFSHVTFMVDGVGSGDLSSRGGCVYGPYESGSEHTVSAIAYDDAHLEDGSSAPNASIASDPISVTVTGSDIDPAKLGITVTKSTVAASADVPGANKGDLWNQYDRDPGAAGAALIASWWWDSTQWVALPVAIYLDQLASRDIQADSAVMGLIAAGIITGGLFKTSGASNYTIINDSGITVYKNGTPYSHMGSDTTYGLQAWDPNRSAMIDVSSQIFGTNYAYETTDLESPTFSVTKVGANWSPWGNAAAPSMKINSPTGRFVFIWDARYIGALHDDVMGSWINLNISESSSGAPWVWSSGDVHANFQNISGDYGGAGFSQNSPGFTMVSLTPNKDYWLFFSHRSLHYRFTGQAEFRASGHCNQRTLIALPA